MGRSGFAGFPEGLIGFLEDLAANNDKTWFDAHRADYESLYLEPGREFADVMAQKLDKGLRPSTFDAPMTASVFRIFRDTRFSKDKTPYKTHLAVSWGEEGRAKGEGLGYYFHLQPGSVMVGGGMHAFSKDTLAAYRDAVVDPVRGPLLREALDAVAAAGPYQIWGETYKRVPRGYDEDHENKSLLLHSGLYAGTSERPPKQLHRSTFVKYCFDRFAALSPLLGWLEQLPT